MARYDPLVARDPLAAKLPALAVPRMATLHCNEMMRIECLMSSPIDLRTMKARDEY